MSHAAVACALLGAFYVVVVGIRSVVQRLRTGEHGLRPTTATRPPAQLVTEVVWGLVTVGFTAAPVLAALDVLQPVLTPPPAWAGGLVSATGIGLAFYSQMAMGASWRIGLQPGERTALVQAGPFALVRNPIFTSSLLFLVGLTLLVPNALMLVTLVVAIVDVQATVRLVEEPHLAALHGEDYVAYARRVGRFLPFLGRWP